MNRETGGALLAFAGFVFLVGAFKGTWRNALHALAPDTFGGATTTSATTPTKKSSPPGLPGTSVIPSGGTAAPRPLAASGNP